jgi:CRISPR-associated protein Cmr3
MSIWLIEPRDPIIFRDGRPFNPTPGARAKSLSFPFPSTLAGAVRTRAGQDEKGVFDKGRIDELLQVGIRGPVLVEIDQPDGWYFPAPADCLVIQPEGEKDEKIGKRLWARPVSLGENELTNLEDGLAPVSITPVKKDKPHTKVPRFWKWSMLKAWLENPANDERPFNMDDLGIAGLTAESRIHVKIKAGSQTAEEGMLFETSGLEFVRVADKKASLYALAVETEAALTEGADFLGGERRLVNWRKDGKFPVCPDEIARKIKAEKACRVLLATPALFENGYLPKWVKTCTAGVAVDVIAAAAPRYQAVSGWDYTKGKHGQKASRRLAPAGSVYFLRLAGDDTAIGQFVENIWLRNISDDEQDRRDGFGLALLGAWDGNVKPLKLEDEK